MLMVSLLDQWRGFKLEWVAIDKGGNGFEVKSYEAVTTTGKVGSSLGLMESLHRRYWELDGVAKGNQAEGFRQLLQADQRHAQGSHALRERRTPSSHRKRRSIPVN